ncbi:MAG: CoB--CoM heterodisulfide reductase iron-sulfur subunit A family protein [Rubrobacteridae bacterium]|nr:CoB--CoM heterodisulfide reductase iron-sulfur subunit A family protein [Rubrobacteridae bacterium]
MARIGVFICHCGSNIAGKVDVDKVAEMAKALPGVEYTGHQKYSCSESGQKTIIDAIKEHRLDRIVIGSCSPKMHEKTFRNTISQAGVNPYLLEIANIREHVSWVTPDGDLATEKAFDLIKAAVGRVTNAKPLTSGRIDITKKALVIGGGIAGIQAALDIADMGHQVILVEKEPSIGGRMAQLDKTFPTIDCSACILSPRMVDVAQHPNITLYTYSEIDSVNGFVGNFNVTIRKKARYVNEKICTGCLECTTKCPEKNIPNEFDNGKAMRRAVYVPFAQSVPKVPVIDASRCRYLNSPDPSKVEVKEGEKAPKRRCGVCAKVCTLGAIDYEQQDELINETVGAIVVATGFNVSGPEEYGEYGGGKLQNVITGLDFERFVNASGPTEGKIIRPTDGEKPKRVVFIQCVGSRDESKGRPYCSSICCMYTAKQAILTREKIPNAEIFVFYMDIRAAGKGYEEFVRRAQMEYDVNYIRGRVSRVYENPNGRMTIKGADTIAGLPVEMEADLVVLASASIAREDSGELANLLGISTDAYGFISEVHPKLKPVEVPRDGVYVAGAAQSPRDIPNTVAMAGATAAKVGILFSKDYIQSDPMVAEIDPMVCVACGACIAVCPYSAITMEEFRGKKYAKVNEAMCQGCGTCSGACRPGAAQLRGVTDEQILRSLEAVTKW